MTDNLISVILPSNKQSDSIISSIKSLNRDLGSLDVEYLINLDGPAIGNKEKVINIGLKKLRLSYHSGPLAHVLNALKAESKGAFIARADDDDLYLPGRLRYQIDYLQAKKVVGVLGSGMYLVKEGRVCGLKYYPENQDLIATAALFNCHVVPHPVAIFRASVAKAFDYRDVAAEDMDLWVRMMSGGVHFANLNVPLLAYSLPRYTRERFNALNYSALCSVKFHLKNYFLCCTENGDQLAELLFDQTTPAIFGEVQTLLLREFIHRSFPGARAVRQFVQLAEYYHPRLFRLIAHWPEVAATL